MYVVLAWFSERTLSEGEKRAAQARFESAVSDVVPEAYLRHEFGGEDWGITVLHRSEGAYRWPVVAREDSLTAVSLGLPVGLEVTGGPVALARRLLSGADVHRDVVPPFGLIALDRDDRCAIQQDWLGMCRLFTATVDGITAFCNRPSLLPTFLHGGAGEPDLDGWASYAVCGHFGGDMSPVRDVRLLQPGERIAGRRRPGGGWDLTSELRYCVDDVVMSGFAEQGRPVDKSLGLAAQSITTAASSISELYAEPITLGLSGGKDSRLIAASLIAAGRLPRFATNEDTAAEGEVARDLVQILRDKRGLQPDHELYRSGAPASVLTVGLHDRTAQLQRRHDFQFPSSYTIRPAGEQIRDHAAAATFTGAAGELSTGYWYPKTDGHPPEEYALTRLMSAVPKGVAAESVTARERERITGLLDHAKDIGLRDLHLIDYIYLVERVRRWYTSAYAIGMVTPFVSPGFVAATFALTVEQKRARLLHTSLIGRLVPEWSDVPFVSVSTGTSTAARIWDGDGVHVIADLLDTAHGPITELVRRDEVEKALTSAVREDRADQRTLRHFTWLATASMQLEPGTGRAATSATYARVTAPPKPPKAPKAPKAAKPQVKSWRSRLRRVKKTRLWKALRRRRLAAWRPGG